MKFSTKVDGSKKINLSDFDPRGKAGISKEDGLAALKKYNLEINEIQELLYSSAFNSVLIVLQGMDTSGKDGTTRNVMSQINPQGCRVISFKAPTPDELDHDFLWRIHANTPAKGMLHIFNRSHYEDVLIVRVHNLQPPKVWEKHYDHINNFEKLLADQGTIILKFFLHISPEEQLERLKAREVDPEKRWKIGVEDYKERNFWKEYELAYESLLSRCSTENSPWYIVPADRKWFRNLAVAESIAHALRPYRDQWKQALMNRGEKVYEILQQSRAKGEITS